MAFWKINVLLSLESILLFKNWPSEKQFPSGAALIFFGGPGFLARLYPRNAVRHPGKGTTLPWNGAYTVLLYNILSPPTISVQGFPKLDAISVYRGEKQAYFY